MNWVKIVIIVNILTRESKMKNLYIDVDGVLITKHKEPAKNLVGFLEIATNNFNCYWLTTHCKGSSGNVMSYLKEIVPEEAMAYLEKIKVTNWQTFKTEAINFDKEFIWLDDQLFESEKKVLEKNNALEGLIKIDLESNPNQLMDFINLNINDID